MAEDIYIRKDVVVDIDFGKKKDDVWSLLSLLSDPFLNIQLISLSGSHGEEDLAALKRLLSTLGRGDVCISLGNMEANRSSRLFDFLRGRGEDNYTGEIYSSNIEAYSEILPRLNKPIVLALGPFDSLAIVRPFLKKYHATIVLFEGSLAKDPLENNKANIASAQSLIQDSDLDVYLLSYASCASLSFNEKDKKSIQESNSVLANILKENDAIYEKLNPKDDSLSALAAAWYLRYPVNFDVAIESVKISEDGELLSDHSLRPIPVIKSRHKEGYMKSVFLDAVLAVDGMVKNDVQIVKSDHFIIVYPSTHPSAHLSVYEAGWEKHRANDKVGPLARDCFIFHFLIDGNCRYQVQGRSIILEKGDCFLIPANEVTALDFQFQNPAEYYWVAFHGSEAANIVAQCGFQEEDCYVIRPKDSVAIEEIMKAIVYVKSGGTGTAYCLLGQLYLLLSKLVVYTNLPDGKKIDYVKEAIRFMNENYDRGISVSEVCSHINVERSYFFRIFKNDTGFSPREYLISLRLDRAKQLLGETQKPIATIGSMVGYPNYVSFCNIFSHRVGVSPSQYRVQRQNENR